jgi:heme/copper-type cytochrome/quinol oxidase subunit 3
MSAQSAAVPADAPEVEARSLTIGAYLIAASIAFFFVAFLFAFFYLRALNSNGKWAGPTPGHPVSSTTGSGTAILVCVVVSVVLVRLALVEVRGRGRPVWWTLAGIGFLLGLAAVAIQCWQYTDMPFGTSEGGYASVYMGWTGFFTILVFFTMVWLEIVLATARRTRTASEPALASVWIVWAMLGLVQIIAFILLYGVK